MATATAEAQRPSVSQHTHARNVDAAFSRLVQEVEAQLKETDGEPLDSPWHRLAINLLIELVRSWLAGRTDYYAGGNMFVYFSLDQIRGRDFRGPDFFFVKNVDGTRERLFWWAFREEGRLPDVIIELLSPSTADEDRTTKKDVYQDVFHTREYFLFDPSTKQLEGWRLSGKYQPIAPNERGWMWCEELGLWLGTWEGSYQGMHAVWPRFFDVQGRMVPTEVESKHLQVEDERKRAESLQAEVTRLRSLLAEKGSPAPPA